MIVDAIPPLVIDVAEAATGVSSDGLRIRLRSPLDAQSNNLYDLWAGNRHLIIKEFLKPEEWHDAPMREFQALQRLDGQDIAPSPVFYRASLGPIVVYEFMDGEMWNRRLPESSELEQLAQLWLRLHALPVDNLWPSRGHDGSVADTTQMAEDFFSRFSAWVEADFHIGRKALAFIPQLLEQFSTNLIQLEKIEPVLCFGRADARFANVIARPNDLSKNLQLRRYLARALAWPNPDFSSVLEDLSDVFFFPARGM